MYINDVSGNQLAFKRIFTDKSVMNIIKKSGRSNNFVNKYKYIRNVFTMAKIGKTYNFDIVICYSKVEGYYAIIRLKDGTTPSKNKQILFKDFKQTPECFSQIRSWISYWNNSLSNLNHN